MFQFENGFSVDVFKKEPRYSPEDIRARNFLTAISALNSGDALVEEYIQQAQQDLGTIRRLAWIRTYTSECRRVARDEEAMWKQWMMHGNLEIQEEPYEGFREDLNRCFHKVAVLTAIDGAGDPREQIILGYLHSQIVVVSRWCRDDAILPAIEAIKVMLSECEKAKKGILHLTRLILSFGIAAAFPLVVSLSGLSNVNTKSPATLFLLLAAVVLGIAGVEVIDALVRRHRRAKFIEKFPKFEWAL